MSANEMVRRCSCLPAVKAGKGRPDKEHAMSQTAQTAVAVIGIDIGKNSFHIVGHDELGVIVLRQKRSLARPVRQNKFALTRSPSRRPQLNNRHFSKAEVAQS
jgi:hypothetical protein